MTVVLFVDDEPDSAASALDVNIVASNEKMAGAPGSAFLTQVRRDFPGIPVAGTPAPI